MSNRIYLLADLVQDYTIMHAVALEVSRSPDYTVRIILNKQSSSRKKFYTSRLYASAKAHNYEVAELTAEDIFLPAESKPTLILTSSESSSPNHSFAREITMKSRRYGIPTIGIQHGYECVGISHHPSQDSDYPYGVSLNTDFVTTWQPLSKVRSKHTCTRSRLIPTGPISFFARLAFLTSRGRHFNPISNQARTDRQQIKKRVLICDNSHSPRFRLQGRREAFRKFCIGLSKANQLEVKVRMHPANRFPVTSGLGFTQHDGELNPHFLAGFDLIISPPSSIIVDAASIQVPVSVWTDHVIPNDTINYTPLPVVSTSKDAIAALEVPVELTRSLCKDFIDENLASCYGGKRLMNLISAIS